MTHDSDVMESAYSGWEDFYALPSLSVLPAQVLEEVSNMFADSDADRGRLEHARVRRVFLRIARPSVRPDGRESTSPSEWLMAISAFQEAMRVLSPSAALELFERAGPVRTVERMRATEYLTNIGTPLNSLEELGRITKDLLDRFALNREHVIRTGWPDNDFAQSPWMQSCIANLYHVKTWVGLDETEEGPDRHFHWSYKWSRTSDLKHTPRDACTYEEAPYLENSTPDEAERLERFTPDEAERLERSRSQFFEVKVAVIRELLEAVERRDAGAVWKRCLALLTQYLTADDVDFYLQMDQRYGTPPLQFRFLKASAATRPGGLSDLLYVIGHFEKELAFRPLAETRRLLGNFCDSSELFNLSVMNYLEAVHHPNRAQLDRALDHFLSRQPEEKSFWSSYSARVNEALENDFYSELSIRVRVDRKKLAQFVPHLNSYAEFASSYLNLAGVLPQLALGIAKADASENREGAIFVRDGDSWRIGLGGAEAQSYKQSKGAVYVFALILTPRKGHGAQTLELFYNDSRTNWRVSRSQGQFRNHLQDLQEIEEEADDDVSRDQAHAREAVRTNIARFIKAVRKRDAQLANHLDSSIFGTTASELRPDFVYWPADQHELRCDSAP